MKKIGIMTWFQYHNYGTALQVVALSKTIEKMNYEPWTINYDSKERVFKLPNRNIVGDIVNKGYQIYQHRVRKQFIFYNTNEREKLFCDFINHNLRFTEKKNTLGELENLNEIMDGFVCGSDQIWSPLVFDSHYYLDFVSDSKKMVAYAPSIGSSEINDVYIKEQMNKLIGRFINLSIREKKGVELIYNLTGKKAKQVLDPTLLLNRKEWEKYAEKSEIRCTEEKYVLIYFLGRNEHSWKQSYEIAKRLNLRVKIIPVFTEDLKREGCIKEAIGPAEFISLLLRANYIITDSFHGTAFSINFNKDFCVFERFAQKDKRNQNSRIYSILEIAGLEDRLYKKNGDISSYLTKIDYSITNKKMEKQKYESVQYLEKALKSATSVYDFHENNVKSKHTLCCGCGACVAVCPVNALELYKDSNGFYQIRINNDVCINCGKCKMVCPFIQENENISIKKGKLYSYKSKDSKVLERSSSGGFAYDLSKYFLERGYAVVGCQFNVERQIAEHIILSPGKTQELYRLQGSKYTQSNMEGIAQKILSMDEPIVFFGTPCQVAGMKHVLEKKSNILFVDLICHGVPSYNLYIKYKDWLKRNQRMNVDNMSIFFRYKKFGWRERYIYTTDFERESCNHQSKDPYFRVFEQCNAYMKSCYECKWRESSMADIRIGDYWGKRFANDNTGVSMVLSMTKSGDKVINALDIVADIKEQGLEDYYLVQQTKNEALPVYYDAIMDDLKNPQVSLEDTLIKYVEPYEKRKRIHKIFAVLKGMVKNG